MRRDAAGAQPGRWARPIRAAAHGGGRPGRYAQPASPSSDCRSSAHSSASARLLNTVNSRWWSESVYSPYHRPWPTSTTVTLAHRDPVDAVQLMVALRPDASARAVATSSAFRRPATVDAYASATAKGSLFTAPTVLTHSDRPAGARSRRRIRPLAAALLERSCWVRRLPPPGFRLCDVAALARGERTGTFSDWRAKAAPPRRKRS